MTFKNYLKISFSNLGKMFKLVFFRVIVWLLVFALMAPCYVAIKDVILSNWNYDLFVELVGTGLFFGSSVTGVFAAVANVLIGALSMLFTKYLAVGIYLTIVMFIIRPFLMNIGRYVVNEMMYGYMSSHAKHSFSSVLVRTLKNSSVYSILRTLFCLPFNLAVAGTFYLLLQQPSLEFAGAMPFVFLLIATVVLSIKQILTMCWAPATVVSGAGAVKSFGYGIKAAFRGFARSMVFAISIYFFAILLSLGLGVISLIIIVPIFVITSSIFEMMHFFSCQGMRYYVDKDTVLTSKRLEERDTISKAKFLL